MKYEKSECSKCKKLIGINNLKNMSLYVMVYYLLTAKSAIKK